MRDLLTLPAEAPAADAWMVLWSMGLDFEYPLAGQTAAAWLAGLNLTPSQWRLIYHRIQRHTQPEPQEGDTA